MTIYQCIVGFWLLVWGSSNVYAAIRSGISTSSKAYGILFFLCVMAIIVGSLHQGGFW